MSSFKNIQSKLEGFYRKYYLNELIKGLILFSSFGLIYFLFTLYLEYFLWMKTIARTLLFWMFISVETFLFYKFIMLPLFQLIKIKRGISEVELSKIIGNYFPEVQDKLLNILQLKEKSKETDLILASVEQKAKQLQPIPFKKAINYRNNSKHIRLLFIPLLILVISMISGTTKELTSSFERVVNHKLTYKPSTISVCLRHERSLSYSRNLSYNISVNIRKPHARECKNTIQQSRVFYAVHKKRWI